MFSLPRHVVSLHIFHRQYDKQYCKYSKKHSKQMSYWKPMNGWITINHMHSYCGYTVLLKEPHEIEETVTPTVVCNSLVLKLIVTQRTWVLYCSSEWFSWKPYIKLQVLFACAVFSTSDINMWQEVCVQTVLNKLWTVCGVIFGWSLYFTALKIGLFVKPLLRFLHKIWGVHESFCELLRNLPH